MVEEQSGVLDRRSSALPPQRPDRQGGVLGADLAAGQPLEDLLVVVAAVAGDGGGSSSARRRRLRRVARSRGPGRAPRRGPGRSGTRCRARAPCRGGCRATGGSSRAGPSARDVRRPNRPTVNSPSSVVPQDEQRSRVTASSPAQTGQVAMTSCGIGSSMDVVMAALSASIITLSILAFAFRKVTIQMDRPAARSAGSRPAKERARGSRARRRGLLRRKPRCGPSTARGAGRHPSTVRSADRSGPFATTDRCHGSRLGAGSAHERSPDRR